MKIAIIGSGIAGLTCAWRLAGHHQITVFEAQATPGGHTATVDVDTPQGTFAIDTGFIVYNDRTYPRFMGLLSELGISGQKTQMSFSVQNPQSGLEYNGHSLSSLFAQRRNLVKPAFWGLLTEIVRFNRLAKQALAGAFDPGATLQTFLERHRFSPFFARHYILPMGAAIWSSSLQEMRRFPLALFLRFFENHGLLDVRQRPQWYVVPGGSREYVRALLARVKRPVLTYGFAEDNVLRAVPLECGVRNNFEVWRDGVKLGQVSLPQPGRHNMLNALAAIGAAMEVDISFEKCVEGLNGFGGVGRRFEFKGERGGVTVVDDYGHHPAEIAATLATARQVFPGRRIVAAFQPHRFSRTQAHFGEFCKVFDNVDQLLLTEIYAASEKPIPGVSGQSLAQGIRQVSTTPVEYFQTLNDLAAALPDVLHEGDVLLTLGAGSITRLGPAWIEGQNHA